MGRLPYIKNILTFFHIIKKDCFTNHNKQQILDIILNLIKQHFKMFLRLIRHLNCVCLSH